MGQRTHIIGNRGEFIDVLDLLRRGHVLVRLGEDEARCVIDGGIVYSSFGTLREYELISEVANPQGFEHARYYRLNERGRAFAERACSTWRRRPLLQRLALRFVG